MLNAKINDCLPSEKKISMPHHQNHNAYSGKVQNTDTTNSVLHSLITHPDMTMKYK